MPRGVFADNFKCDCLRTCVFQDLLEEAAALQGVPKKVVRAMQRAAEEHKLPARAVDASLGDAMSIMSWQVC